jgi:hypothetical protein
LLTKAAAKFFVPHSLSAKRMTLPYLKSQNCRWLVPFACGQIWDTWGLRDFTPKASSPKRRASCIHSQTKTKKTTGKSLANESVMSTSLPSSNASALSPNATEIDENASD